MTTTFRVRPLTQNLWDCAMLDLWPNPATCVDFGIDNEGILGLYQRAIKRELVTIEELDQALGDGPALTEILRRTGAAVEIKTAYDGLSFEEED